VLVRTATHSLLYDTGPRYSLESDAGHRVLVPLLRASASGSTCWC
jgi:competence protein ComEC